jgi:hypothetical protein
MLCFVRQAMDWFRNTTWNDTVQLGFEAKLKRARPAKRPQYLYLQSVSLLETDDPSVLPISLSLARRSIVDFPEHIHRSAAQHVIGQCFERQHDSMSALSAYLLAVEIERQGRCILTDAYLDFSYLVALQQHRELFDRALALLDEFAERPAFPVQHFRWHASRALIADGNGNRLDAAREAHLALQAASHSTSGFQFHENLGLVGDRFGDVRDRLHTLAG